MKKRYPARTPSEVEGVPLGYGRVSLSITGRPQEWDGRLVCVAQGLYSRGGNDSDCLWAKMAHKLSVNMGDPIRSQLSVVLCV